MVIKSIINEPVPSNCYVIYDSTEENCIVVDPGSINNTDLLDFLDVNHLTPQYIILTHEHFDHIWGVNDLVSLYRTLIVCSELCSQRIQEAYDNCSALYDDNLAVAINAPTISIESLNKRMQWGKEEIVFYTTPGHSDASICFTLGGCLFTGDALLKGLKTVTKLPTGSKEKQKQTLNNLRKLQGMGMIVYPGHGESFELDGYNLDIMVSSL